MSPRGGLTVSLLTGILADLGIIHQHESNREDGFDQVLSILTLRRSSETD